mmetsp:Transcript_83831/g.153025  ORF Transcript_83831/g.153025 Transcript_83831/m.153025 type:complete len:720 (-) Transcript_83831:128-2287(-)
MALDFAMMYVDWALLESSQRLQREKCVRDVGKMLAADGLDCMPSVEERVSALLSHSTWEGRHGGLLLLQEVLHWYQRNNEFPPKGQAWTDSCLKLLPDKEVRVRTTCGEVIALLCQLGSGLELYDAKVAQPLLTQIESNMTLERDGQAFLDDDEATKKLTEKLLAGEAARQSKQKGSRSSRASSMQSTIYHDTAGWGSLETDVACLQHIIDKCCAKIAPRLNSEGEVLEVLCTAALHTNRFVRGIAFRALDAVVRSLCQAGLKKVEGRGADDDAEGRSEFFLDSVALSSDLVARIGSGLCDEWANVRMEASVVLRTFLTSLETPERRERFYNELLPRLCVNRYYVAVGVASYTRETWRLLMGDQGRQMVTRWLPSLVPFYIMQTKVANSEARDAAAKCIGELAARVDQSSVSPYAEDLFQALIPRLSPRDAWEVKESTCQAIVQFVRAFPDRFNLSADFPQLVPSLSSLLADKIVSVREGAALAFGELIKVSNENDVASVLALCLDGLKSASKEADERQKYGEADLAVLKRERDNDIVLHSNQKDVLDCCAVGDLEEDDSEQLGKLSLSKIYNQAQRDKLDMGLDTWERTDGCLYLAREIACSRRCPSKLEQVLVLLASISMLRHFVKHVVVLATLWKVLPEIATVMGAGFNEHLEGFMDSFSYSVSCEDDLTVSAAKTCLLELSRCMGHDAFSECVRRHNPALLDQLSSYLTSRGAGC